ncbi:MAG: fimbrial biogenesis outer membrane usher protein [Novosphingobium sp.]|nr:fimbrial biogenesis outer membrane usher protein [Novosphingobium sp.]MBX9644489.1 fimbria/pilus outer membrane usher protein [Novosphingobium sp.]
MAHGGKHLGLLIGASLAALAQPAMAGTGEDQSSAPQAPAARTERLNPTGRAIILTVPAKDGPAYLGDMPLTIGADDSLSFPAERTLQVLEPVLAGNVLTALRSNLAGKPTVGPQDFASVGILVTYDPRTLELRFEIPVEKRASRSLSVSALDRRSIGNYVQPAKFSAYLNIRGSVDLYGQGPNTGFEEPVFLLNGAMRLGGPVLEGDAIWSPGNNGVDFQRLGNRLVFDDTKNLVRYSAGDLDTQGRGFQAAPDIAGLSIFRSYSVLNPQRIIRPRGDRTFTLARPSTVEVYVNGQQVRRIQLGPGNYNLRDFPFAQGGNDIRLNVLDDTGRNEVLRFNLFLDQTQLGKGLSEFGLYAGVKAPLGLSGPNYSDEWIVSGFYRRGISDRVTLGANFQADEFIRMGGVEAVFGTSVGTIGTQAAFSNTKGWGDGYALQATFQRQLQHSDGQADTFNLFVEHRSRKFAPVSFFLANNQYQYEVGGGYTHAFNQNYYAGAQARFSKGRGVNPDIHSYSLSGGWRFSPIGSLTAELRYTQDSRGNEISGFITVTVRLGRRSSLRSEYDSRNNRERVSFQTLSGTGVGSYNVTADVERTDFGSSASVNANYFGNRAELGISHFGSFNGDWGSSTSQRTSFRFGTSLAIADGTVSIGRPIYDSFALVKGHKSLKGGKVVVDPTPYGLIARTDGLGAATMPSLSSYSDRTVTVDVDGAPAGVDIGQGSYKLFPAYRSGYVLQVGSDYHVTAMGTMLDADGQPVALVAGKAVELAHPDRPPVTVFTNRQGRFGATGLAPGQWRIEMLDGKNSVYVITIPADAEGVVRVGEIMPTKER